MRDCQGNIIGARGGPIRFCDAILAETMGLLEGLKLAKSKGVIGCILEGDSMAVKSWGRGKKCDSWRVNHFFAEIRSLINVLNAELVHVPQTQFFSRQTS